jgi:lipopolysaccharide/colanic/teichoic acid biosynthesis glycosyltransferase
MKFRTMRVMEDGDDVVQVSPNDERLTAIGAFLRRTSIDELPQLINVLRGEMSLVGPRPHALLHDEEFVTQVPDYNLRFRMRPGITGLAQTSGLRGSIVSPTQIAARVALDNAYIDDWSLACDLKILIRTALGFPFHRAF